MRRRNVEALSKTGGKQSMNAIRLTLMMSLCVQAR